ncbi:MAG: hypothetical protein ACXVB9_05705 [Bdellovibrionota bacterium]
MRNLSVTLAFLLLAAAPIRAMAEDLCESRESVHERAVYCHQNPAFVAPAKACVDEYSKLVTAEQASLKKMLDANMKNAKGTAQNQDFGTDAAVLASSIAELDYLLDYGKQVHTELEDYVFSLTPPIFSEDERGDPSDPAVKARYMSSDCFADTAQDIEGMELQVRPWVDQLEKTKAQLVAMSALSNKRDGHLDSAGTLVKSTSGKAPGSAPARVPSGTGSKGESTITGKIHDDKLDQ